MDIGDTFESRADAMAYLDGNYDALNDMVNDELGKASGTMKKELTADDVLEVDVAYTNKGWKYVVHFNTKLFEL